MFTPLRDNNAHIEQLCNRLNLGKPREALSGLAGGFHHRVWRLETERGTFVIKQLAPDTDLTDKAVINHYNVIDEEAYLVFPWTDAVALNDGEVSSHHALAVAELLAKMHNADIEVLGVESELGEPSGEGDVEELVDVAMKEGLSIAPLLNEQRSLLMRIARQYQKALPLLERRQIISHGDMDQKNVLWDSDDKPVIIDWEAAHRINPTQEVVSVALEWSGSRAGGTITPNLLEAALHCELGKWLDWLMYNIGRLVNLQSTRQHTLGEEQIEFILPVMVKLDALVPSLVKACLPAEKL